MGEGSHLLSMGSESGWEGGTVCSREQPSLPKWSLHENRP